MMTKRIFSLCVSLTMVSVMMVASNTPIGQQLKQRKNHGKIVSVQGEAKANFSLAKTSKTKALLTPSRVIAQPNEALKSMAYGFLIGPDGKDWYYTENFTFNGNFYSQAEITVYDNKHDKQGVIKVGGIEGRNVNMIEPFGYITKKFFDRNDATLELLVNVHATGTAQGGFNDDHYETRVFSLNGDSVMSYPYSGIMVSADLSSYETYQRLLLPHEVKENGESITKVDVMAPAGYGQTEPKLEHTFSVPTALTEYCNGSFLNFYEIDHTPYYILSYYEKPWADGYDLTTWDPIVTPDNHYEIHVFDRKFKQVDSISVELKVPDNRLYRFAAFNQLSDYDLSKGYFTDSNKFNYVVTYDDYDNATDDDVYNFYVFDNQGMIKTIAENVVNTYGSLKPIPGFDDQMYFMQNIDGVEQIQMVDMPSCAPATLLPAQINGETISTTFDRYPVGDSYQYIISLNSAEGDAEGNVIARLGWYTRDAKFDHFTRFNLGPKGELFRPLLNASSLNPYLFDTDDALEFIFIAKIKKDNSNEIEDVLMVGKEDGSIIYTFRGDDTKGKLRTASLLVDDAEHPELMLICYDYKLYNIEFQHLPFAKFAKGGEGTVANPYLVATAGDLQQMRMEPAAAYKLANDIDMRQTAAYWQPVDNFSGQLDGDNYAISNLRINSHGTEVGLFGNMAPGASVKNLVMLNPEITVNRLNSNVGVISGATVTDTLSNIHVYDASIVAADRNAQATVGGLVGFASVFSEISGSSFRNGDINLPTCSMMGGIVGDARTSTNIVGCYASGNFTDSTTVGGIVGQTGMGSVVANCHTNVNISAQYLAGGIVGYDASRAAISNCVAEGMVSVNKATKWGKLSAGGILGYVETDWTKAETIIISNNISNVKLTLPKSGNDGSVNRIVGFTAINENYEQGETRLKELGLANNYATAEATIGGEAVSSTDATTPQGATKAVSEMSEEWLSSLGYVLGESDSALWRMTKVLPVLRFENKAQALVFSTPTINMQTGEVAELIITVYGADASEINVKSTNPTIADVEIIEETANALKLLVTCKNAGNTTIKATAGNLTATCAVNALVSAIDNVEDEPTTSFTFGHGVITMSGAASMNLYNANGQLIGHVKADALTISHLNHGVYVATAIMPDGSKQSVKFVK